MGRSRRKRKIERRNKKEARNTLLVIVGITIFVLAIMYLVYQNA